MYEMMLEGGMCVLLLLGEGEEGIEGVVWSRREIEWHKGFVFFFQAEAGIRALVRSRRLGDVYEGQDGIPAESSGSPQTSVIQRVEIVARQGSTEPVPYTHLTPPTILRGLSAAPVLQCPVLLSTTHLQSPIDLHLCISLVPLCTPSST